jgi:hypothetical protein
MKLLQRLRDHSEIIHAKNHITNTGNKEKRKKPAHYRNMTPCNQKQPSLCMMIGTNSHKPQYNGRFKKLLHLQMKRFKCSENVNLY